uniref:Adaptor related protein complex 3 subunit beta 2 n=1 Tax=Apteryx owenii TaxID=8824 RepID=A0A8B9P0K1_APTOW
MAFEEVCPERIDLIHKNYRKLCNLLIDVEEWGQVVIINMLTRYARTQFLSPNQNESLLEDSAEKAFYGSDEEDTKDAKAEATSLVKRKPYVMDPDHRLLLRNTKPLLQSRNAAVVMAVAQLYFHLAPKAEVGVIAKALVRLLRSHSEVQYVVLQNVATMSIKRRGMFEPYLKSFYIRSTDPTQIKILKLEVLTNLANETNISTILREFQTYIRSMDKDFVAATIQAIGRCATNIGKVRDTCLNGLVQLLSNRDELVVAESVVVIKKLLQMQPAQHSEIIKHMAKLTDNIQVPMARASILWLIGEYCEHVPKIAPDVLRKMAKSFTNEEDIVKLQVINLAAKLYLTNSKQSKLLTQYVLNLAKYDQNYDIRDRARFIRQLIVPTEKSGALNKYAKKLFLAQKPAPILESSFKDRDHFQLGSLSHLLNAKAVGYQELPDWPDEAPDPSVRNVEVPEWTKCTSREKRKEKVEKPFYSDSEGESGPTESADSEPESVSEESESSSSEGSSSSGSEEEEEGSGDQSEDKEEEEKRKKKKEKEAPRKASLESAGSPSEEEEEEGVKKGKKKKQQQGRKGRGDTSSEEASASESSSSESDSGSEAQESPAEVETKRRKAPASTKPSPRATTAGPKEISLLDLDDFTPPPPQPVPSSNIVSTSLVTDLEGLTLTDTSLAPALLSPAFGSVRTYELLHRMTGEGLSVEYCFSRRPFPHDPHMVAVQIQISNNTDAEVKSLRISEPKPLSGMRIQEFPEIGMAQPGSEGSWHFGGGWVIPQRATRHPLGAAAGPEEVASQAGLGAARRQGAHWVLGMRCQPCAFREPGAWGHCQRGHGHRLLRLHPGGQLPALHPHAPLLRLHPAARGGAHGSRLHERERVQEGAGEADGHERDHGEADTAGEMPERPRHRPASDLGRQRGPRALRSRQRVQVRGQDGDQREPGAHHPGEAGGSRGPADGQQREDGYWHHAGEGHCPGPGAVTAGPHHIHNPCSPPRALPSHLLWSTPLPKTLCIHVTCFCRFFFSP